MQFKKEATTIFVSFLVALIGLVMVLDLLWMKNNGKYALSIRNDHRELIFNHVCSINLRLRLKTFTLKPNKNKNRPKVLNLDVEHVKLLQRWLLIWKRFVI